MQLQQTTSGSDLGVTSISGSSAGAVTKGEVRNLPIYGPGGYVWRPATGQKVLVMKGGTGGEERCVAGAEQQEKLPAMAPGEVYIHAPNGSIYLNQDGAVELMGSRIILRGRVDVIGEFYINGKLYKPCTCN